MAPRDGRRPLAGRGMAGAEDRRLSDRRRWRAEGWPAGRRRARPPRDGARLLRMARPDPRPADTRARGMAPARIGALYGRLTAGEGWPRVTGRPESAPVRIDPVAPANRGAEGWRAGRAHRRPI